MIRVLLIFVAVFGFFVVAGFGFCVGMNAAYEVLGPSPVCEDTR